MVAPSTTTPDFDGDTYKSSRDKDRLTHQLLAVKVLMSDAKWRTLGEISEATGAPEASISARLRDLRKEKFGGYLVERKYHGDGLWTYRVMQRVPIQLNLGDLLTAASGNVTLEDDKRIDRPEVHRPPER